VGSDPEWRWDSDRVLRVDESVSDTTLLQCLVDLAGSGGVPSREGVLEQTLYHPAVYVRRFGSWTAALESADVLDGDVDELLDEEILDALHSEAERLGRSPTPSDFSERTLREVLARFGTWNNALFEAGVELVSASELTEIEQFVLYTEGAGGYWSGLGEFGFFRGWAEHHAVLEFLVATGEERFTVREFAAETDICEERAEMMLEFVSSMGGVRRDDDGWVVRVDEQEEVAGLLLEGKSEV